MPKMKSNANYRRQIYLAYEPQTLPEKDYQTWARAIHTRVKGWLPQDLHTPILDLGCGAGQFLYLLHHLGYTDITGVDLSPARVREARRVAPQARVMEGDLVEVLSDNPGHFELISGFDVLEHFSKAEIFPVLALVAEALRDGGRVIFQVPNGESPWGGAVGYGDFTHEWWFTPGSLTVLLEQVGLKDIATQECGPIITGWKSALRFVLWQFLRAGLLFYNLVETGRPGSGILTRVFLATAVKRT